MRTPDVCTLISERRQRSEEAARGATISLHAARKLRAKRYTRTRELTPMSREDVD
jgi:hypothetical protein